MIAALAMMAAGISDEAATAKWRACLQSKLQYQLKGKHQRDGGSSADDLASWAFAECYSEEISMWNELKFKDLRKDHNRERKLLKAVIDSERNAAVLETI